MPVSPEIDRRRMSVACAPQVDFASMPLIVPRDGCLPP